VVGYFTSKPFLLIRLNALGRSHGIRL